MAKNIVIAILAVMLGASLLGNVVLSVTLWGMIQANNMFSGMNMSGTGLPNISITPVQQPTTVPPNQTFALTYEITNTDPQNTQSLNSIDFYTDGANGQPAFQIMSTQPAPKRVDQQSGFASYIYEQDIQPGQSQTVTISVQATQTGMQTLNPDFCINTPFNIASQYVQLNVDPNAPMPATSTPPTVNAPPASPTTP